MGQDRLIFTERPPVASLAPIYAAMLLLVALSVLAFIYAALPQENGKNAGAFPAAAPAFEVTPAVIHAAPPAGPARTRGG
jgi:hypothetical protein